MSHCKEVWNTSTAGGCCLNCLLSNIDGHPQLNETQCKARDGLGLGMMITQLTWKRANATARNYCLKYCRPNIHSHPLVPSDKGTRISADWWWLCGHRVYTALPKNWTGRCALVEPANTIIIVGGQPKKSRMKRELADRGKTPAISRSNPVPKEHRLWTGWEKFWESIIPNIGISELQIEVEVTRYELIKFMNDTTIIFDGIKQEMRGLRLMTLQNRLVLDQLTASQGGVCVIVGDSCCTYVPDNDADGHLIDQGIRNITKAVVEMTIRERNRDDWDWSFSFSSLFLICSFCEPPVIQNYLVPYIKACCSRIN